MAPRRKDAEGSQCINGATSGTHPIARRAVMASLHYVPPLYRRLAEQAAWYPNLLYFAPAPEEQRRTSAHGLDSRVQIVRED